MNRENSFFHCYYVIVLTIAYTSTWTYKTAADPMKLVPQDDPKQITFGSYWHFHDLNNPPGKGWQKISFLLVATFL